MRKSLVTWVALLVIMATVLSACGGDNTPTPAPAPTATTAAAAGGSATSTTAPSSNTAPTATTASGSSGSSGGQLPRNETLYVAGFQWQPPTNFNPLNNNPDWPSQGGFAELYETLFVYNQLSGNLDPLLAKDLKVSSDGATMDFALQNGTKWQDGQDLTTDDVLYSYNLAKTQPDVNYNTLFNYIDSITATSKDGMEIKLKTSALNPGFVKNFLTTIRILPKQIGRAYV